MPVSERYAQLWRELEVCDETGFDYGFCVEHPEDVHDGQVERPRGRRA